MASPRRSLLSPRAGPLFPALPSRSVHPHLSLSAVLSIFNALAMKPILPFHTHIDCTSF